MSEPIDEIVRNVSIWTQPSNWGVTAIEFDK